MRWIRDRRRTTRHPSACARSPSSWRRRRPTSCDGAASRCSVTAPVNARRGNGAGEEHTDRPGHGRRHRNRTAAARPAGRTAAGRPNPRRGRRRIDRRSSAERLTWVLDPIDGTVNFVYGIGPTRCRSRFSVTACQWPVRSPTSPPGRCTPRRWGRRPRHRAGVTTPLAPVRPSSCQCRWWAPDFPTRPSAGSGRPKSSPAAAGRARRAPDGIVLRWICAWWPPGS